MARIRFSADGSFSRARTAGTASAARMPSEPMAARKAALTAPSGSASPAVSFRAVSGATGRNPSQGQRRTPTDAGIVGVKRLGEQPDGRAADLPLRLVGQFCALQAVPGYRVHPIFSRQLVDYERPLRRPAI